MKLGIGGKKALVTGASRGIGRSIALALAKEGAQLILVARSNDELLKLKQELAGDKNFHYTLSIDLQASDGPKFLFQSLAQLALTPDIIVHNLGGSLGVNKTFASIEDWQKVWHFNVGIAHILNCEFIPAMKAAHWGRIVHISTLSTRTNNGYPAYISAKYALEGYVQTVSRELSQHNIILNAIAPGLVYREGRFFAKLMVEQPEAMEKYYDQHLPIRRMAQTEEIASVVAFMCSEQASYMPGAIIRVDGGGC